MAKKKIFVSFDFKNDRNLKNEIVGLSQADGAIFQVASWSNKPEDINSKWLKETKYRLSRCDVLLILIGEDTSKASGVLKEVEIAKATKMKIIQLKSHDSYPSINGAGSCHDLNPDKLNEVLK